MRKSLLCKRRDLSGAWSRPISYVTPSVASLYLTPRLAVWCSVLAPTDRFLYKSVPNDGVMYCDHLLNRQLSGPEQGKRFKKLGRFIAGSFRLYNC